MYLAPISKEMDTVVASFCLVARFPRSFPM